MIDFYNRQKTWFLLAVFFLAASAVFSLIVFPLFNQIKKSSDDLARNRRETETFFANWRDLKKSQETTKEIKNRLDEISPVLPKKEAIKFIEALEKIAAKTGNKQEIDVSGQDAKTKNFVNFQISLQGGYPALIDFLENLEALSYISEIKTIGVSGVESAQGGVETLINLSVLTE